MGPVLYVHAGEGPQVELLEGLREPALAREQFQEALALLGPPQKLSVSETKRGGRRLDWSPKVSKWMMGRVMALEAPGTSGNFHSARVLMK